MRTLSEARQASSGWVEGGQKHGCGHRGTPTAVSSQPSLQDTCCFSLSQRTVPWAPRSQDSNYPGHVQIIDLVHSNFTLDVSILVLCSRVFLRDALLCTGFSGQRDVSRGVSSSRRTVRQEKAVSPGCRTTIWSAQEPPHFYRGCPVTRSLPPRRLKFI